ncbi:MAG TPA: ABC transporter substrate-binding protein [Gemmatimonadales bacterium]|nr:ABC transporter substrate-binding protein [Gemmatimonadales bacterium]
MPSRSAGPRRLRALVAARPLARAAASALALVLTLAGCGPETEARGATVLFASGADLQSINPLLTVHPLARQVQRYVLLTTLVRYDAALVPQPYLARAWRWSADRRTLTFTLHPGVRWHDGTPTTARDVAWTLDAARDTATGYPRLNDLAALAAVRAPDDTTVELRFRAAPRAFPDVLTDLAILPRHLLDTVPHARLRKASWNERPVGNGPFRFVAHEPNRRWVFAADSTFPAALGGPPRLRRLVVAVVDEPTTKLAALAAGELDFAGIQPAHAAFVEKDPHLEVLTYPLLLTYGVVLNTRRPPFDDPRVRAALSLALDRREIVEGYLYGFGTAADGPVPPALPGYVPTAPTPFDPDSARRLLGGRTVAFELLTVGSGEAALEQMVQAQLRRAGFDVRIRQLELSAFLGRTYGPRHEFDAAVLGIPGDPGLGYLRPLAELAGMTVPDEPAAAQRLFAERRPVAFLYHARGLQGKNRRVEGVRMDLRGELPTVAEWWAR